MKRRGAWLALFCLLASTARAVDDPRFTVVRVDPRREHLEIYLGDAAGQPFGSFARLRSELLAQGKQLRFAMNAGMYHEDRTPVGLLVRAGREETPLRLGGGTGNFFLLPNGVFFVSDSAPHIVAATQYKALAAGVQLATQSGPLLLRRGAIHPAFIAASPSRLLRNGVGICGAEAVFVISEVPVNFHEFASYFRDALGCSDALYLDGTVSSLYSTALGRNDARARLGPMFAVTD